MRLELPILALAATLQLAAPPPAAEPVERRTVNDGNVILEQVPEIPDDLGDRFRRFQNIRQASFQAWTVDGSAIYLTTRFGDTSQLHRVAAPGGARRQLTFYDEPVFGVARRPGSDELTFLSDTGGSEFNQVFLFDPASGEARRLTEGASRNGAVRWAPDGSRFAYQSTRRNGAANDIWLMDPAAPESTRLLLEAPDGAWWGGQDWSPDGTRLLVLQYVSVTDSRLWLVDVASGERRLIAGGEARPGNYSGVRAHFDASGGGIFLATDRESRFTELAHLSLDDGTLRRITGDIPWDVESFALADDYSRAAFVVNEGGVDRLYLMDPTRLAYRRVESLPVGVLGAVEFSPSGDRVAMTLNTSRSPSDVWTLSLAEAGQREAPQIEAPQSEAPQTAAGPLAHGELTRWTESEVGGLDPARFVEPELVDFATFDEVEGARRRIPAFLYKPPGEGPFPVIVSIHGGPEGQFRSRFNSTVQLWNAELGAAVVAPNVRGSSGYGKEYVALDNGFRREDSVRDVGALLDWIATRPDLDSDRVAVYGGSYGGYMVLASLVHFGDRLRAGVEIVGISNFVTFLENTQDYRRDLRRVEYGDERDPAMRAHLERISPNRNVDKIRTPLLVAQGRNDPRVPASESEQIVAAVRDAGFEVWYMSALNEGHGFRRKENRDLYRTLVVEFLRRHLDGAGAPPGDE